MKKILLSVALCAMALTASAQKSYVVYQGAELTADQVQIPQDFYNWTHLSVAADESQEGKPLKISVGEGTPGWWGGGYLTQAGFDCSEFTKANYDLVFDVKADTDFATRVKLVTMAKEGGERGYHEVTYDFPHDGAWHTVTMNMGKVFPNIVNTYQQGDQLYSFTFIGANDGAGKTWYADNIRFQPHVSKAPVADKVFFGSKDCIFTPMGVQQNNGVQYKFTSAADGSFGIEFNLLNPDVTGMVAPVCRVNGTQVTVTPAEGGKYIATSPAGFEQDENVNVVFGFAYAMGATDVPVTYVFGSESVQELPKPLLTATVGEVTATTAVINWAVTLPAAIADATDVAVVMDGVRYTTSPILLENLSQNTEFTYTLTAEATKGEVLTSAPATVKFRTAREGAVDITYSGRITGTATGNLNGDLEYVIDYTVTYTAEGKLHVTAKVTSAKEIVGLVPQLKINGPWKGNFNLVDGIWQFTTSDTYVADETLALNIFFAYAGGACNNEFVYTVGQNNGTNGVATHFATAKSVEVYSLTGAYIRTARTAAEAVEGLLPGIYVIGGKKVAVK